MLLAPILSDGLATAARPSQFYCRLSAAYRLRRPPSGGKKELDQASVTFYSFFMGLPIHPHPDPDVGETCEACEGLAWGEGKSRRLCRIVLHRVVATPGNPPAPNNVPVTCEQVTGAPCNYEGYLTDGGGHWQFRYYCVTGLVTVSRVNGFTHGYFWGYAQPCMAGPFPNDFPVGSAYAGGGSAVVLDLPLDYVLVLASDFNLQPEEYGLYDITPCSDPDFVCVRLVGIDSPGSCYVRYELPH